MLGIFHIMGSDPNVFLLFRFLCIKFHASQPTVRSLPAAHHEEVCKVSSGVGSYPRSQYITISSSFTDAFLPSSLHSTINHRALRRLCYRRCLIAGMFLAAAITAASQTDRKTWRGRKEGARIQTAHREQLECL